LELWSQIQCHLLLVASDVSCLPYIRSKVILNVAPFNFYREDVGSSFPRNLVSVYLTVIQQMTVIVTKVVKFL
jgi:hypothetical protein